MSVRFASELDKVNSYNLAAGTRLVLLYFIAHGGWMKGGAREFSKVINISPRSFQRHVQILVTRNLIEIINRTSPNGSKACNEYKVTL